MNHPAALRLALLAPALVAGLSLAGCRACCDPCARPTVAVAGAGPVATAAAPAPAATASAPASAPERKPAESPYPAPGTILDHRKGERVSLAALAEALDAATIVYVGESHDQAEHHAFQAKVLAAVAERSKGPVALGLEMFFVPFQEHLDAYVAGTIDEATMLEKTEWKTRWGYGWEMYAPMLRYCREHKVAVVALNAPKEITRTVSRQGLDALTPEQRATLPPLDMSDAAHRAFVKMATSGHGHEMKADAFERMYTSMVIWDETMSSSAAAWLEKAGEGARMVVVAGNGHIADRYGIPGRAARKTNKPYLSIVQEVVPANGEGGRPLRFDTTYADYTAWWRPSSVPMPAAPKPKAPPAPDAAKPPAT